MKEKLRILIVTDNADSGNLYKQSIKDEKDYNIQEVKDVGRAMKAIKKNVPDIILCDLNRSGEEGMEFCKTLKADPESLTANIYFIMISGEDSADKQLKCISEGADDYLAKPVNSAQLIARIKVGRRISLLLKKTKLATEKMFQEMDILLIQEGGCAPGYNPVTAFITHQLEAQGRQVYATREGFKSLVLGRNDDFLRLVYDPDLFKKLDHIPGVFHSAPLSEWRGAQLRSERYRDFLKDKVQEKAASTIKNKKVKALIAIGGNGTFRGMLSLCEILPTSIQAFFVPVTIDSDVAGTDCIGQYTGVEFGAEKIRCYMADARTHKRTYIIEMMGANSGFHALHSCLGARAHMAVLPDTKVDPENVVNALNRREECVIVVAEGYKKEERDAEGSDKNAAEFFYRELLETGMDIERKVVCEPFSRDIRGATPNNMDVSLAQRMAYNVASYLKAGTSRLMPAVLSGREYAIPFNEIETDNMKEKDLLVLSNRLTKNGV